MEENKFQLADYIIFGVMLLISVGIGVFYACAGGKQQTNREFLMADRSMRSLPVALSVLASFFSASTLLGTSAEVYVYGIQYWISVFGAILAPLTGAFLFGPMFFKLKLVSVYEVSFRKENIDSLSCPPYGRPFCQDPFPRVFIFEMESFSFHFSLFTEK